MIQKLQNIDRRIIYLFVVLTIVVPLLKPVGLPFSVGWTTQAVYDKLDSLPPGAKIAIGVDYSPGAAPQIHPQALAVLNHLFFKDVKIIFTAIATTGPMFTNQLLDEVDEHERVYGEDYVHLGYLAGTETAIAAMAKDFHKAYPEDNYGTPISELPLMAEIQDASDLDAFLVFTASEPSQYVRQIEGNYGTPLAVGINSVIVSTNMPYVNAGQMFGLMNGLRGAAEYEVLSGKPAAATASMDALSAAHVAVLLFMLIGNIAYFVNSRQQKGKGVK